ncbi:MAG TPA: 2Fe-2S iron-sulfur cluster-binding protein [Burkholderiaceae bacterium]|nr:2Fe-2S iron-sulfur cluster-binding protein [Burkholderiaceae bacterium]
MPRVTFVSFTGERHVVDVSSGITLMRAAVDNDVPGIDGDCGGNCACATCHVYIESPWAEKLSPKSDAEDDMLGLAVDPLATSRLGCQIRVTEALDGIVVHLPQGQH